MLDLDEPKKEIIIIIIMFIMSFTMLLWSLNDMRIYRDIQDESEYNSISYIQAEGGLGAAVVMLIGAICFLIQYILISPRQSFS